MFESQTQQVQPPPPPPSQPSDIFASGPSSPSGPSFSQLTTLPEPSTSPVKNVDTVKDYLAQAEGRTLNPVEIAGLVSILQRALDGPDCKHAPLRLTLPPERKPLILPLSR